MLIATDPLSLFFIVAFLLGLVFFIFLAVLGNLGHGATSHIASHDAGLHLHVHPGAVHGPGHTIGHAPAHAAGHSAAQSTNANRVADHMVPHTHQAATHQQSPFMGYLNPTAIFLFLFGFGLFGYLFHNFGHLFVFLTLIIAVVGGLLVTVAIFAILERLFGDSEGSTIQDVSDRTGLLGKVSITIPANNLGEIIYTSPGGMRKSIPARSIIGERLERDQEVVVVNYQRGVAEVDTWDHFMSEEHSDVSTDPHAEDLDELRVLLEEAEKNASTDKSIVMQKDAHKE